MTVDADIARLARRQRGYVKTAQMLELGISRSSVKRRVIGGELIRVHQGVYAFGQVPRDFESRAHGAWLAVGPQAWLSHTACAALYRALPEPEGPIHLTRPTGGRRRNGIVIHAAQMPSEDRGQRQNLPLTGAARLLLDLAETESTQTVARAYNELQVLRLLTRSQIERALPRWNGRKGVAVLKDLVEGDLGNTRSVLEDVFVSLIRQSGLPFPSLNVRVLEALVDAVWERERVIVELDGRRFHDTDPRFESDRARDARLAAAGYVVLRFTHRRLKREPLAVIAELAAVLSRRSQIAA